MNKQNQQAISHKVLENLTCAVALFGSTGKLNYINTAGEILFGDSARHLLGLDIKTLFRDANKSVEHELKQCLSSGVACSARNVVLGLPDNPATVNLCFTPLFEGHQITSVAIELHQVDRHLRLSKEEQLLAQQSVSRMLARGLAHEIKNPLGGLRGAAQLLNDELESAELKEYTQIIIEESDRLQALMDRMLGPNRPPQKDRLNIHRILERVRQLVQAEAVPSISIIRDYDPSIPPLFADHDQMIQAILNIARNAVQSISNDGTITFRTRIHRQAIVGSERCRLAAKIDIIDDGPGIKPELIGQIFYPMITSRPEGTGLGLSIAQSLINQHGGIIECESRPGRTIFSIRLPLENEH